MIHLVGTYSYIYIYIDNTAGNTTINHVNDRTNKYIDIHVMYIPF